MNRRSFIQTAAAALAAVSLGVGKAPKVAAQSVGTLAINHDGEVYPTASEWELSAKVDTVHQTIDGLPESDFIDIHQGIWYPDPRALANIYKVRSAG